MLKQTALFVEAALPTSTEKYLEALTARVTSAFDAQIQNGSFDTGRILKMCVNLYPDEPVPEFNPPSMPLASDQRIVVTGEFFELQGFLELDLERQIEMLLDAHVRGLVHLAERFGWRASEFEEAGKRAKQCGIIARMHLEKLNRNRTFKATIDGSVDTEGFHLVFSIWDARTGELIKEESRTAFGDYWTMLAEARRLTWTDNTVELEQRPDSTALLSGWHLSLPDSSSGGQCRNG